MVEPLGYQESNGASLHQLPASIIERIEIINNPSAKYDADAEGGIINMILKTNEVAGTNGAFAVGAGLGERYRLNAAMLLNHKANNWNFGIAYDNWYGEANTYGIDNLKRASIAIVEH